MRTVMSRLFAVHLALVAVLTLALVPRTAAADARIDQQFIDAVKAGARPAAAALLKKGARVNTREADGTTALHWAVRQADAELVAELVRAGADVKVANRYGVTPLS